MATHTISHSPTDAETGTPRPCPPSIGSTRAGRAAACLLVCSDTPDAATGARNVPPVDGRLLRLLAEAVGAQRVVEIGTSTGESVIWLALGLRATGGKLLTHEIDAGWARVARENFRKAAVAGVVTVIEGDAHETVRRHKDPIDVLFLDADKEGYVDYIAKLLPLVRPGGLVVAHDMNRHMADPRYVAAITRSPALETAFLYLEHGGISVALKKR